MTSMANVGPEQLELAMRGPLGPLHSGGMLPQEIFGILSILNCLVVHSESSSMQSLHEPLIARSLTMLQS